MRDMSKRQFEVACKRRGFRKDFFGYWQIGSSLFYARNGGQSYRNQLRWLIKQAHNLELEAS